MGIPGKEKEKGIQSILKEIMAENFPSLRKKWTSKSKGPQIGWTQIGLH